MPYELPAETFAKHDPYGGFLNTVFCIHGLINVLQIDEPYFAVQEFLDSIPQCDGSQVMLQSLWI